ncbi:diacylglycerol kinase family protein, partial [Aeromonas veronii]|uniref:diacylglycerol kinase family protein n=1 Tax=Aeromonas veronii TaxID=654 RepID=UPI00406D21CD
GSRSGESAAGVAVSRLGTAGFDLVISTPTSPREVAPWIEAHAGGAEAVVVVGGDGSLNAAAPALVKTGLPLGILPAG